METGRSDLCSRHQHGSSGHSSWFVIRVTQLCQMSQVCRKLARCAEMVAVAAVPRRSYLSVVVTVSVQRVLGQAACGCLCQIASRWLKRGPFLRRQAEELSSPPLPARPAAVRPANKWRVGGSSQGCRVHDLLLSSGVRTIATCTGERAARSRPHAAR